MFDVEAVPRIVVNQWPVDSAGLPTRVINSVHTAGVHTVGELRAWKDPDLLKLRSLGKVSLHQIHEFFALCDRIESGRQRFRSIRDVLSIFLDASQFEVIGARYGLDQPDLRASRNWVTLQEIGNREDKTRERIRQIEELGKQRLQSRLATVCLEPFYKFFEAFIRQRANVVAEAALGELRDREELDGINPSGILLLLSDLASQRISYRHGFFSTLSVETIQQLEFAARDILEHREAPVTAVALCDLLKATDVGSRVDRLGDAAPLILDHAQGVGASTDDRYFLFNSSVQVFLAEIVDDLALPVHYRKVAARFNDRVKPGSRRGAGYILEAMNKSPHFLRVDRGMYTLREDDRG